MLNQTLLVLVINLFILSGCGRSPLLHHRAPKETIVSSKSGGSHAQDTNGDDLSVSGGSTESRGCPLAFSKAGFCAAMVWNTSKLSVGENHSFRLYFWKDSNQLESDPLADPSPTYVFSGQVFMPCHGHGSKLSASNNGGRYTIRDAIFTMPGDWDIILRLTQGGTVVDEVKVNVTL